MSDLPSPSTLQKSGYAQWLVGHTPDEAAAKLARIRRTLYPEDSTYCAEPLDIDDARWLLRTYDFTLKAAAEVIGLQAPAVAAHHPLVEALKAVIDAELKQFSPAVDRARELLASLE